MVAQATKEREASDGAVAAHEAAVQRAVGDAHALRRELLSANLQRDTEGQRAAVAVAEVQQLRSCAKQAEAMLASARQEVAAAVASKLAAERRADVAWPDSAGAGMVGAGMVGPEGGEECY